MLFTTRVCSVIMLIIAVAITSVCAQENEFHGIVFDTSTGEKIAGVTVQLKSVGGLNAYSSFTRTDAEGHFSINLSTVKVDADKSDQIVFTLSHNDYAEVDFTLAYNPGEHHELSLHAKKNFIRFAGTVIDASSGEPIEFAAVQVIPADDRATLTRPVGTVTNENGRYDFSFTFSAPLKLYISHIAFHPQVVKVNSPVYKEIETELIQQSISGDDIVVTSNIVEKKDLKEKVTVDRISSLDVQEVASMNAFDLVSTLREVDVSTQSMNMQTVSTRGFNTGANPRFLQLTDGVDNQAPGLGFPVGNLIGPTDLDIAVVDLIVGPASARYGPSAMNGVLLTSTKDPYIAQGLSFSAKTGMHNFKFGGSDPWAVDGEGIYDLSIRYARAVKNKFAIKVTGQFLNGTDWSANNYNNIGYGKSSYSANQVAGYNGVNIYGDEGGVIAPVGLDENGEFTGEFVPVYRTGYKEEDLVNYDISTRKAGISLHYKFTEDVQIMAEGRYGYTNTLYTSDSRIRLENFRITQYRSKLSTLNFEITGYITTQNSGDSYNVNYLADNLLRSAKGDRDWFRDFEIAFTQGLPIYFVKPHSVRDARRFADSGVTLLNSSSANAKYEPGTPEFEQELNRLKGIYSFNEGAGIKDNSSLYHVEATHEFDNIFEQALVNIGGSFRYYDLQSEGTIFPDTANNHISNYNVGIFTSFERSFLNDNLDLLLLFRVDKNENLSPNLNQQIGMNYQYKEKHFFRLSVQKGARTPTVREQFLNSSISDARLLGGLNLIHDTYELQENSFLERSVQAYEEAIANDLNSGSYNYNRSQAELKNLPILESGILRTNDLIKIKSERTVGFEGGYRQLVTSQLYFDINYFVNFYTDFIGIKRVVKPRTSPSEDLFTAAGQATSVVESDRYYVYSNSDKQVLAQGVSFDLRYNSGNFQSSLNGTWTNLLKDADDPIIPGYNTPPLKINFEWGNRELIKNVGFKIIFRGRTAYDWQSPFLDGRINGYGHFDFQFTIRMPSINAVMKSGVTNMGVKQHYDSFGGPKIGSILFTTLTVIL